VLRTMQRSYRLADLDQNNVLRIATFSDAKPVGGEGCARRNALVRQCQIYGRAYLQAVRKLGSVSSKTAEADTPLALELADRMRVKSATKLEQLRLHKQEHGC
jgi:hypothetical protein